MKNGLRALGLFFCVISSGLVHASTEWSAQDYDLYSGDFNGDGKTDILYIAKSPGMPSGIAISDSSGAPNTSWQTWASDYLGINWSGNAYNVIVADFNGDHKADILLQSKAPLGDSYLLLTSSAGFVVSKLDIPNGSLGFSWSADQHHIVAGDFNGDGKADLFFQATSPAGTNYVVLADTNGTFTVGPAQSWTDGTGPAPPGFKWSTQNANVFAGDFNGDGKADLLIQAKPNFVMIDYDVPFPVPTYPPNRNAVVLSQGGATPFIAARAQTWSRMSNGVDWSPLTNNIIIATPGSGNAEVILQGKYAGKASYELTGNSTGPIFPSTATTLSSNVSLTADSYHLIAGNYGGVTGVGLYYQALTPSGTNYVTDAVGATTTAFVQNPTTVTRTVEATSVGRTMGRFAVSSTGSAQYSIPIWAPPGPRGIQPNIALSYNSRAAVGPLGIGWSLAGLGQITRCNLTTAQDSTPAPVALVTADGYCINGNRLRLTSASGTYGAAGSTYQTEIADFSQITANGNTTSGGVNTGPASFTVQGRDGNTYQYGLSDTSGGANSQVLANGSTTALTWMLSKIIDRSGNTMVINYLPQTGPSPSPPALALSGTTVPDTILWTPTSAGATTYAYKMKFNYAPNMSASSIFAYVAGTPVANAELLSSIEIFSGATVVKDYFLGYQSSRVTGRQELISVQECADAGQSNCLLPTSISYQDGSPGVSTAPSTVPSSAGAVAARYDFNGDGFPDLVYNNGSTWFVAFGSASGYGTPFNTGISVGPGPALFGNVTGGHEDGILKVVGSTWTYYLWNGSSFVGTSITGFTYDASSKNYILADINGDGLPDLFSQKDTTTIVGGHSILTSVISYHLNTSSSTTASFNSTLATAYSTGGGGILSVFLQGPDAQYGKLRRYDFNGDGRDDLIVQIESGATGNLTLKTYELISTGTAFRVSAPIATIPASATFIPIFFTNWNDDKCTDFVTSNTLYISGCNGSAPQTYPLPGTILLGMDWDGDGRTDILVYNGGANIGVYLSPGTSTVAPSITPTSIPYSSSCTYVWMDANADGLDDLGCFASTGVSYYLHNGTSDLATSFADGYGVTYSPSYVPLSASGGIYTQGTSAFFPDQDYIGPLNVVSSYTSSDGIGGTYPTTYTYAGGILNLQGRGFQGFTTVSSTDSRTGLKDTRTYSTGSRDLLVAIPTAGMLLGESVTQSAGTNVSVGTYGLIWLTLDSTANNQRYFPYTPSSSVDTYEVQIPNGIPGPYNGQKITTTAMNYGTPDIYGNFSSVVKTITDQDPGSPYFGQQWTTTTATTISASPSTWCNSLPTERDVTYTAPGVPAIARHLSLTPDYSFCRETQQVVESNTTYQVTEALGFDGFGNIQTDTVTGSNMPSSPASRVTTRNWGTTGQFLNSIKVDTGTVANPTTATTSWAYSSSQSLTFGVPDSVTDPNNLQTSWTYDLFGRKNKETRPDGTSTTWTWSTCTSFCGWSNSFYQIAQTNYQTNGSTVIRTDTKFYDPVDRVTESSGPTVSGSTAIVQNLYNSTGLLAQQSLPRISGATAYQKTYSYDALNRLTSVSRPVSSTISTLQSTNYSYAGRTFTVKDPYGNTKTTINDVNGWLRQTKDAVGYNITRAFDAAGSLIGVTDSVGNTLLSGVSYNYGLKPLRVAATDADRGAWTYTVDSLGERIGWRDAKNQSFAMTYDALSRPVTRTDPITTTDPGLFTQWQYGSTPASHNVGQLIMECSVTGNPSSCGASPQYSETRSFDSIGRLSTRAISEAGVTGNDPGGVFLFTSTFSPTTGLPNTLTYPISTPGGALNIQYGFQYGLLQSVTDTADTTTTCGSSCTLWTANAMNAFGEITQETLGNGVVTNRTYDAVTSWLSGATAGVGGGAALLNQSYLEDENGNVTQRQQNNAPGITESFAYDADNRLICTALSSTCTTPTLVYDGGTAGPGNITSQTGVGAYAYPAAGQPRPHAVTAIAGTINGSFSYDPNGNMTSRAGSVVAWSSYNYPTDIAANDVTGSEEVQLSYGPDRQRWKQIYTGGPSGTETTYYIGGLVDLVFIGGVANYRHYINAGGEPVAVYNRTATGNTMSYMLEDHQGSVSAFASNSGTTNANESESFSAFGARRNPTTWSGAPTTANLNTIASLSRQGYTLQTWLGQSMGLNHMNGRVEDAILGRFLSPDPHVTDPSNAQSYNRYSYVNNNPLSNTDPTGFDDCTGEAQINCIPDVPTYGATAPTGPRYVGLIGCMGICPDFYTSDLGGIEGAARSLSSGVDPNAFADPYGIHTPLADLLSLPDFNPSSLQGFDPDSQGVRFAFGPLDAPLLAALGWVGDVVSVMGSYFNNFFSSDPQVNVWHYTSVAGKDAIGPGGLLNPGSFVTTENLWGMTQSEVAQYLEIAYANAAFSSAFTMAASNLKPAYNGTFTSGFATQFQVVGPTAVGFFVPTIGASFLGPALLSPPACLVDVFVPC